MESHKRKTIYEERSASGAVVPSTVVTTLNNPAAGGWRLATSGRGLQTHNF